MAIIGYVDNTSGADITAGTYTIPTGVSVCFYAYYLFQNDNYSLLASSIEAGDLVFQDVDGVALSVDDGRNSVLDTINEINELPPLFVSVRPYNNAVSKYLIGDILNYIEANATTNSEAATKYDLIDDLTSAFFFGSKMISLGDVENLSDPFYTTAFKDKLTDFINSGFQ